jgi:ribosomal protein L32
MLTATILQMTISKNLAQRFQASMRALLQPHRYQLLQPALVGIPQQFEEDHISRWDEDAFWFAVPKRKHTRSRKRKKTTVQKRLKLKQNIVFDPRTGEVTLQHRLPFNWKDYLPKTE